MKSFRRFAVLVATISCLCPLVVSAQSTVTTLNALYAQIALLQAQIQALGHVNSTTTTSVPSVPVAIAPPAHLYAGVCPNLQQTLSVGSTGADVANLQAFLAGQGLFKGAISASFGVATQTALQEWQSSRGIVVGGSPGTTGWGVAGPRTRMAIAVSCGYTFATTTPPLGCVRALLPPIQCDSGWVPVADPSGCITHYLCATTLLGVVVAGSSTPAACPAIAQPTCINSAKPFSYDQNGCVKAYQCSI